MTQTQMKTEPKERPILFSSAMVRAILEGRKTQTRRVVKPQPYKSSDMPETIGWYKDRPWHIYYICNGRTTTDFTSPYGKPGDRLWVRERTRVTAIDDRGRIMVEYEADGARAGWIDWPERLKGRPHLKKCLSYGGFRESSRITLEITSVRVERLQDISEEDAKAEGVGKAHFNDLTVIPAHIINRGIFPNECHRYGFGVLWDKINGKKHPWELNPWVWVVEFRRVNAAA